MSPSLNLYKNVVLDRGETVSLSNLSTEQCPGAPLTFFNDGGGGGGGGPKDFFGCDILAKRDFLGSMKDAGICLGRVNNTGIFLGIVFSTIT